MEANRDSLAPFGDRPIQTAARQAGLDQETVRALVRRHQEGVRALPGVDDLVYEWRRTLPDDPLVARFEAAYVLVIRPQVWSEFTDHLDLSQTEAQALRSVHDEQARSLLADHHEPDQLRSGGWPMVLTRP